MPRDNYIFKYKQLNMNEKMVFLSLSETIKSKSHLLRLRKGRETVCVWRGWVAWLEGTEQGRVRRASPRAATGD